MSRRPLRLERWEYGDPLAVAIRRQGRARQQQQRKQAADAAELDRMRLSKSFTKRMPPR